MPSFEGPMCMIPTEPSVVYTQPVEEKIFVPKTWQCSCIKAVRKWGADIPLGTDAKDIKPDGSPTIGGLVIFKYRDDVYHVAKILCFGAEGFLIRDANYIECEVREVLIDYNNKDIAGFNNSYISKTG